MFGQTFRNRRAVTSIIAILLCIISDTVMSQEYLQLEIKNSLKNIRFAPGQKLVYKTSILLILKYLKIENRLTSYRFCFLLPPEQRCNGN